MVLSNLNIFVVMSDLYAREFVLQTLKKLTFIDCLNIHASPKEVNEHLGKGAISYLFIDRLAYAKYKGYLTSMKSRIGEKIQFVLLLNSEPEDIDTVIFDHVISEYSAGKITDLFNKFLIIKHPGIRLEQKINPTEMEILNLICNQKTCKEIAQKLCLGTRTIENYRSRLLYKTKSKNTAGLVIFAVKNGVYKIQ